MAELHLCHSKVVVGVADSPTLHSHIVTQLPVLQPHNDEIYATPLLGSWVLPRLLVNFFFSNQVLQMVAW